MSKPYELVNFCEIDKYAAKSYCAVHDVDPGKNLGDITKVDENKLPEFNCIFGGSPCFVAGTKVYTDSGYKNIENVVCGDNVLTHKGRFMPVLRIGGECNKEIWSIRAQGFLETYCTDYHPFYVKTAKDAAPVKMRLKDIEPGYYVGHLITNSRTTNTIFPMKIVGYLEDMWQMVMCARQDGSEGKTVIIMRSLFQLAKIRSMSLTTQ